MGTEVAGCESQSGGSLNYCGARHVAEAVVRGWGFLRLLKLLLPRLPSYAGRIIWGDF